jgi:hypothetical protein
MITLSLLGLVNVAVSSPLVSVVTGLLGLHVS